MFQRFVCSPSHGFERHMLDFGALVSKRNGGVNRPVVRVDILFVADLEG